MRLAAITIMVLMVGLIISGCTQTKEKVDSQISDNNLAMPEEKIADTTKKIVEKQTKDVTNTQTTNTINNNADTTLTTTDEMVDDSIINPDIGTLDDTPVSDELPQY